MDTASVPNKNMLIISNNVLSYTKNNGKTILSFIDELDKNNISQLYFNGEKPSVPGYSYYQLSDRDIIKGFFNKNKRGRFWNNHKPVGSSDKNISVSSKKAPNVYMRIFRELLWFGRWKSRKFISWLDEISPDVVFFVGGDSGFAYNIVNFVAKRYKARLITYITDDYIMPRSKESFLSKKRRLYIKRKMISCIRRSNAYFTISGIMQKEYEKLTGKKSQMIMNMTPSLLDENNSDKYCGCERKVLIYTGSLYYGRDRVLGLIADAAEKYNCDCDVEKKKIEIKIYSNGKPSEESQKLFQRDCCSFCGALDPLELKRAFNSAYALLFVESFDKEMMEKTKYSLSTKVPEYMSVRKPIFAAGPSGIGSMDYLSDVAFHAFSEEEIEKVLFDMMLSSERRKELALEAENKYNRNHDIKKQKQLFLETCFEVM